MKIIISPSKTQNQNPDANKGFEGLSKDSTLELFDALKALDKPALAESLKIKGNLLDDVYELYKNYNPLKTIKAIDCYQGIVFDQLEINSYDENQTEFLNSNIVILSAMYGVLRPNDYMMPYRLDMTHKPKGINLYDYWKDKIDKFFEFEEVIINLASLEFSKMLSSYKNRLVTIDFKDLQKDGKLKTVSIYAKKARGKMLNQIIKQEISTIAAIKSISVDGYVFNEQYSKPNLLTFIKE